MTSTYEWPSFFRFQWEKDEAGYVRRGGAIVALGGASVPIKFNKGNEMAHREFSRLPFSDDEALLAFINRYGLLGIAGGGPPKRERLADIWLAHTNLSMFVTFAHDDLSKAPEERNRIFNLWCPQHMSVLMEQENGKTVLKVSAGSLLAWMWLRLSQEKASGIKLAYCALPGCGGQWYVGKQQSRKSRKYCDEFCKAAHHYGMDTGRYPRTCKRAECGAEWFEIRQEGSEPREYCSDNCRLMDWKRNNPKPPEKGGSK